MLKKLRTFFAALLLVPVLTLNASAFANDAAPAAYAAPPQQELAAPPQQNMCWFYFVGTWWLLPC